MKVIIPMAGRGTRVRPHSHVTPKPLLPVRGENMVARIVDLFNRVLPDGLDEAVYILGPDFGADVRTQLTELSEARGVTAHFAVQEEAHGTAHAVDCAAEHLHGEGIVVYADTLFDMAPGVDLEGADVIVWVKEVEDPRRFGIAIREGDKVVEFEEKPEHPRSNEALIGIYYIKDLSKLKKAIDYVIDNDLRGKGGEYFLTDAFDRMLQEGLVFKTAQVTEWLDCGTISALMDTTRFILAKEQDSTSGGTVENSIIHEPVYIGEGAQVVDAVVGPNVSIEAGAEVRRSVVRDSIIFGHARVEDVVLAEALVGHHAEVRGTPQRLNIGDHSSLGPRA